MEKNSFWQAFMEKMALFGFGEATPTPKPPTPPPALGDTATAGGTKTIASQIGNPFG